MLHLAPKNNNKKKKTGTLHMGLDRLEDKFWNEDATLWK